MKPITEEIDRLLTKISLKYAPPCVGADYADHDGWDNETEPEIVFTHKELYEEYF